MRNHKIFSFLSSLQALNGRSSEEQMGILNTICRFPGIKHRVSDFRYHDYTNIWQGFKLNYSDSAVQ
jgi:hypothetical protein